MSRMAFASLYGKLLSTKNEINSECQKALIFGGEKIPTTTIEKEELGFTLTVRGATLSERIEYIVLHSLPAKVMCNTILHDLRNKFDQMPAYINDIAEERLDNVSSMAVDIQIDDVSELSEIELAQLDLLLEEKLGMSVIINEQVVWSPKTLLKEYSVFPGKDKQEESLHNSQYEKAMV